MIGRRQIALLDVVAGAGLVDAATEVDAKPVDHVARPAAAVALQLQRLFGRENAAVARALGMKQEVTLLAEQAEAVLDFPGNLQRRIQPALRRRLLRWQRYRRRRQQSCRKHQTEGKADHGAGLTLQLGRKYSRPKPK